MDIEKIVQAITKEVLKQIDQREHLKEKNDCKKVLILDTNYEAILNKLLGDHLSTGLLLYNLEEYEKNQTIESYDYILLPCLSVDDLVNIATGVRSSLISKAVSDSLLYSKTVLILEEGLLFNRYRDTCNRAYFQMLENYRKCIEGFGIRICMENELVRVLINSPHSTDISKKQVDFQNKRLITESDLQKLFLTGCQEVLIGNKAMITPLARDYIKEKNIKLIRAEAIGDQY